MSSPAVKKILDALRANHDEAVRLRLELEKHLTNCASARPAFFNSAAVESVLAGETQYMKRMFIWERSPQGDGFWRMQSDAGKLSPEGRAILEKWLAE